MSAEPGVNGGALQPTDIVSPQRLTQSPVGEDGLEEKIISLTDAVKIKGKHTNAFMLLARGSGGIVSEEDLPGRLRIRDPRLDRNHRNQLLGAGFLEGSSSTWEAPTNRLSLAALMQLQNMKANGAPVFDISTRAVEAARSWGELQEQKAELRLKRAQLAARSALREQQAAPSHQEDPSLPFSSVAPPSAGAAGSSESEIQSKGRLTFCRKRSRGQRSENGRQNQADRKAAHSRKSARTFEESVASKILKKQSVAAESATHKVARANALSSRRLVRTLSAVKKDFKRKLEARTTKQNAPVGRLRNAFRGMGKAFRRKSLHPGKDAKVKFLRFCASSGLRRRKVTMQGASRA